jgi:hypothetical protein
MPDISLIADMKTELAAVKAAKTALLTNGQKHSLNGSHSFEGVSYSDLCRRERELTNTLLTLNGAKAVILPDFSGV